MYEACNFMYAPHSLEPAAEPHRQKCWRALHPCPFILQNNCKRTSGQTRKNANTLDVLTITTKLTVQEWFVTLLQCFLCCLESARHILMKWFSNDSWYTSLWVLKLLKKVITNLGDLTPLPPSQNFATTAVHRTARVRGQTQSLKKMADSKGITVNHKST